MEPFPGTMPVPAALPSFRSPAMSSHHSWRKQLDKRSRRGFVGYPVGTLAFYGPDDRRATKAVASIMPSEDEDVTEMLKLFSEDVDARVSPAVGRAVTEFFHRHHVRSIVMPQGLLGCPHEEGIDYPDGETCPRCPFWADRDRWANAFGEP